MTIFKLREATNEQICEAMRNRNMESAYLKNFECAVKANKERALQVNARTNVVRNNTGIICQLVSPRDREVIPDMEHALQWYFMNEIANSCSRLARGFVA